MAPRVDFKHVRQNASFEAILAAYGIELIKDGQKPGQFKALCPFHEDTRPSLKINAERNVFHCFACEAGGNILEFVRDMDGLGEDQIRKAAFKVAELSGIAPTAGTPATRGQKAHATADAPPPPPAEPETPAEEEPGGVPYNRVLTFKLKLSQDDALMGWLAGRGLVAETVEAFGLGRASARSKTIADRLAIPIHNKAGELVAYCGRHVGDDVPEDVPKYVLPKGFRKDLEVFNLHRIPAEPSIVFVYESYFSVMRHHTKAPGISFMGRSVSQQQIELINETLPAACRLFVVGDGDEPGRAGARSIAGDLAPLRWVRVIDLPDGVKPHHLTWEELRPYLVATK